MNTNLANLNKGNLEVLIRKIFNYISINIFNPCLKINCNCDIEELLVFLNVIEIKYELKKELGILNIWTNGYLYIFPINNKGFFCLNITNSCNGKSFTHQIGSFNYVVFKEFIWHKDYKPLYTYSKEDLKNIFLHLNSNFFLYENISIETVFFSKEHNSIIYLNTGLKVLLNNSNVYFVPHNLFIGKYPYKLLPDKNISSFKEAGYFLEFIGTNSDTLNSINFNFSN